MKRISVVGSQRLNLSPVDSFIGKSCAEINSELSLNVNLHSRSFARSVIERMLVNLGVTIEPVDYQFKMIRVDQYGNAKNPSPFKVTDYHTIISERWESSEFRQLLTPTYIFFVVTHGAPDGSIFKGYVLHDFTDEEMESARMVWLDTQEKIRNGMYDSFLTDKETGTFFFKIHAANVYCQVDAPRSGQEITRSFWMSRRMLSRIISKIQ
ncbi:MAG: hypothetical protein PUK35_04470 [Methanomassiliicoccales archaeon]|nr:hypothetical protein [Methanomassiliicoccales archaeon]MDD7479089.1 hypothetical protein [Methanomassiliicoccales archaeon]